MSVRHANDSKRPNRNLDTYGWVRPADWPALPWVADGDQAMVGLIAVFDTSSEYLTMTCAGAYTVDWGDGTAPENVATGVMASHTYDYAALSSSVTSRGYKTAIVTITPQAGQNLTLLVFYNKHASQGPGAGVETPWLDVQINAANLTTLGFGYSNVFPRLLESVNIRRSAFTVTGRLFDGCFSLRAINSYETKNIANANNAFNGCRSMVDLPPFDWSGLASSNNMFNSMYSLKRIVSTNFPNFTDGSSMYQSCCSLEEVPDMYFPKMASAFLMFGWCSALRKVGNLNTTSLFTSCNRMFEGDYSLEDVSLFYTGACTNASEMFKNCSLIKNIPLFDFSSATLITGLFNGCNSVVTLPLFNFSAATNASTIVNNCYSLREIPAWDFSNVTTLGTYVLNCYSLSRVRVTGVKVTHSYANCNLSATALNEIFTNLASGVTAQTITITGNPGAATCTPSIATAKGWTVVT